MRSWTSVFLIQERQTEEDFQTEKHRWLYNILWSDPIPDDDTGAFM